jgi:hypothetical protein
MQLEKEELVHSYRISIYQDLESMGMQTFVEYYQGNRCCENYCIPLPTTAVVQVLP